MMDARPSDWKEHDGSRAPVRGETRVNVRLRGFGYGRNPHKANQLRWDHRGILGDIIEWRRADV